MKIEMGLFDAMVLQRTKANVCDATFSGATSAKVSGPVRAKVTSQGRAVKGFADVVVGRVTKGTVVGRLKGLAVGGPYEIALSVSAAGEAESLTIRNVLVGDVWLLGGQSNMQGIGQIDPPIAPHPMVRACYMTDRWDVAQDVIHDLYRSVDKVHSCWAKLADGWGRGPGVPFGQAMFAATGVPQGLIPCAHGGSAMVQWDPALKKLGGGSMFGAAIRRVKKNGGRVAGVLWYQGCSDTAATMVDLYERRTQKLFAAFRRECGDPRLPIVMVQIARLFFRPSVEPVNWNRVQDIQRRLALRMRRVVCVPAVDLPLDDCIHISGRGQIRLGVRLADAMLSLTTSKPKRAMPMELDRAEGKKRGDGCIDVHVTFRNVVGRLTSRDEPRGFAMLDMSGQDTQAVYATELVGGTAILHTKIAAKDIGNYSLSYGHDLAPVCNIVDEGDRSLPVFRGQYFGKGRAVTSYLTTVRTSRLMAEVVPVDRLKMPDVKDRSLGWHRAELGHDGWVISRHEEIVARSAGADRLMHFSATLSCSEAMKVKFMFGYDGPFVMWIDGQRVWCDPKGTNPIVADRHSVTLKASKGEHRIVVSMCTNTGLAWGFCLRAERLDVPVAAFRRGPSAYAMPGFSAT